MHEKRDLYDTHPGFKLFTSAPVHLLFSLSCKIFCVSRSPAPPQVNLLCQAASLLVAVKTQQFKREIAAKKDGGKSKTKRGSKDKKASKQA